MYWGAICGFDASWASSSWLVYKCLNFSQTTVLLCFSFCRIAQTVLGITLLMNNVVKWRLHFGARFRYTIKGQKTSWRFVLRASANMSSPDSFDERSLSTRSKRREVVLSILGSCYTSYKLQHFRIDATRGCIITIIAKKCIRSLTARKIYVTFWSSQDEIEYAEPDVLAQYKQEYGSFYIGLTQVSILIKYVQMLLL